MYGPHVVVAWVDGGGGEHRCEGELCLVNQEQVIVMVGPKAVCCIPERYHPQIAPPTAVQNAESIASSKPIAPTTSAVSVMGSGRVDVSGNVMEPRDY